MGMARVTIVDETIRRSTTYPTCWYCPRCEVTFGQGGGKWAYCQPARGSTNPRDDSWYGGFTTVDGECPRCRRVAPPSGDQQAQNASEGGAS